LSWFGKLFKGDGARLSSPEDVVRFYQQLGFFSGGDPTAITAKYAEEHGEPLDHRNPWDDVFLLGYSSGDVWADDPEADVCRENQVYTEVLQQWAAISKGAFAPGAITEQWEEESGPIKISFELGERQTSVAPRYQDDWIDLEVLLQINALVAHSGRQFECAVDGNFALVLCLSPVQKGTMKKQRQFPFAW
jgi:hypothetical protein